MVQGAQRRSWGGFGLILLVGLAGCENGNWSWGKKRLPAEPAPAAGLAVDPILAGTIGSLTYLGSVEGQPVRGFGIVMGLGENGSSECPTVIRDYLIQVMSKEAETWPSLKERRSFKPGELIDSLSTAVVEVSGFVPAGAPAGARFDVQVQAIPGTSTRSLAGGLLLPGELFLSDPGMGYEELLGGKVVGRAGGPVFVNPFVGEAEGAQADSPRRGYVLNGGQSLEERTVRLLLREPSYPVANRLHRRINERFGQRPPAAEALSRGYLVLHTPAEFATRPQDFIQLVVHVYLEDRPAFVDERLRELARLVVFAEASYERISLAWEGMGRTALAALTPLYSHEKPAVRFYAARAGLRLKEVKALPVVGEVAAGPQHGLALLAIRELGQCQYPQAGLKLTSLLDHPDQEIRIAAYEALLHHRNTAIQSVQFRHALDKMQLNFILDTVESKGKPLIYVRRTRVPRIAVFNAGTPVTLPLFYTAADDSITLNAGDENGEITLFTKRAGRVSNPIVFPPRVVELIGALGDLPVKDEAGRVRGAGLPYSQVVQILAALSRDGTIPARLEVERASLTELLGPEPTPERPEADEPAPAEEDAGRRDGASQPAP